MHNQKRIVPPAQPEEAYLFLLRPFLSEPVLYAQQLQDHQGLADTQSSPADENKHFIRILGEVIGTSEAPVNDKIVKDVAAALLSEDPVGIAAVYESALRSTACKEQQTMQPDLSTSAAHAMICIVSNAVLGQRDHGPSSTAPRDSLAAAAADPQHLGQNLWSLLMSGLKGVHMMDSSHQNGVTAALQAAAVAIAISAHDEMVLDMFQTEPADSRVVKAVSQMLTQKQPHSSRVPAAAAAAVATDVSGVAVAASEQLWLVLVGRSLYVLGEAVKQMFRISAPKPGAALQLPTPGKTAVLTPLVPVALAVVQWLGKQLTQVKLPHDLAATAYALLDQQRELQAELEQEVEKMEMIAEVLGDASEEALESTASMCLCAAAATFSNLGAALCTELPINCCCANPSCGNMNESSELLLASKGFRCSSCRVVRYCGVACQRRHWKLHKPVCARYWADRQPEAK